MPAHPSYLLSVAAVQVLSQNETNGSDAEPDFGNECSQLDFWEVCSSLTSSFFLSFFHHHVRRSSLLFFHYNHVQRVVTLVYYGYKSQRRQLFDVRPCISALQDNRKYHVPNTTNASRGRDGDLCVSNPAVRPQVPESGATSVCIKYGIYIENQKTNFALPIACLDKPPTYPYQYRDFTKYVRCQPDKWW